MKTRKDGEATRESILKAASLIFGEKGYHKATHAEICKAAGVNTALINFHFGSKDELYQAVWERVDKEVEQFYPIDGGVPSSADASERLRSLISCLLNRALDPRLEGFHRIISMERINPTGLLDKVLVDTHKKLRSHTLSIIQELLGPDADDKTVKLCEMSIISQCHVALPRPDSKHKRRFKHADVDSLTQHITAFSLAGIAAIRQQIQEKL